VPRVFGSLEPLPGSWFPRQHPTDLPVIAVDGSSGELLAQGCLDPYDKFELDIETDRPVAVEIRVALPGVVPVLLDLDDADAVVVLYFDNNQNSRL
jgi:hypothetical protein